MRIDLNPELNVFFGRNAQGKTNLLEAACGLSDGRSFRGAHVEDLIRRAETDAAVDGVFESSGIETQLQVRFNRTVREYRVNGKLVHDVKDFAGRLKFVIFSAECLGIAYGEPKTRRDFLDRGIFSLNPSYLLTARTYKQVLRQRNELLRQSDRDEAVLQVFTERLVESGSRIIDQRIRLTSLLQECAPELHRAVSGADESIELVYQSSLGRTEDSLTDLKERFFLKLEQVRSEEYARGATLAGPHRDDLEIRLNGIDIRLHGSRGQRRSCVMALKLAELTQIGRTTQDPPILLLDDIASELDRERLVRFISLIPDSVQVLMTLNAVDSNYFRPNMDLFSVDTGRIENVSAAVLKSNPHVISLSKGE